MTRTPLTDISVCIFDAYGTLFDLSGIVRNSSGVLGDRVGPFADLWRRKQLEYTWLRSLMGRHTDFWHVTGESLDYTLKAFAIDDVALRTRLMEAYLTPGCFPDAKPALESLKSANLKTAILSNGSPTMLISATKATGLDLLLSEIMSVEAVGVFKPHPSVYRMAAEHFGCQADNIAFVSSNGWDVAGAAAFGFCTIWVNRAGLPRDSLPGGPHREIATLQDLSELLPQ
jgi:2-haloacid dehalogenase